MKKPLHSIMPLVVLAVVAANPARAGERIAGPVPARLLRVVDGDTVLVELSPWFGQRLEISVRLEGIDAPEMKSRCPDERHLAITARDYLQDRIGEAFVLREIRKGKYFGRVIARIETLSGEDISQMMIKKKLARPYHGKTKRIASCEKLKPKI